MLRLHFDAFFSSLKKKIVQKNVGINVVNLYREHSVPYLGINIVGRENVGVGRY